MDFAAATITTELAAPHVGPGEASTLSVLFYARDGVQVANIGRGEALVVGRMHPADVRIDDPSLSRRHARLSWSDEGLLVEDLGSKNGTFFSARPLACACVRPGAEFTLGNVVASVRLSNQAVQPLGFDSYDRFLSRLADEVLRARGFRRDLALVMLRAETGEAGHLSRWVPRVRAELRPVDAITMYAPGAVLLMLPELPLAHAVQAARALARRCEGEPRLLSGVASYPEHGSSADALIAAAKAACRDASADRQVATALEARTPSIGRAIVSSPSMLEVYRLAQRAALGQAPVLILGETGTGKELVARAVHEAGPRRTGSFTALNCAAIPTNLVEGTLFGHERGAFTGADRLQKGVFEEADGGTLFLDELGELSLAAQAALLRVLETKRLSRVGSAREITVDVRVVAATHRDLEAMVAAQTFRADLLHRLNLITLELPPLRERPEEIEPLALRFLDEARVELQSTVEGLSPEALDALHAYAWPGNVRELRNVIERAVLTCTGALLELEDLPARVRGRAAGRCNGPALVHDSSALDVRPDPNKPFAARIREYEIQLINAALAETHGNQKEAAKRLDMPLRTLVFKLRAYGIRGRRSTSS